MGKLLIATLLINIYSSEWFTIRHRIKIKLQGTRSDIAADMDLAPIIRLSQTTFMRRTLVTFTVVDTGITEIILLESQISLKLFVSKGNNW